MSEPPDSIEPVALPAATRRKPRTTRGGKALIALFGAGTLAVLGSLGYLAFRPAPSIRDQAILATQQMIKRNNPPGSVARFNPPEWTHFEELNSGKLYVAGWVEVSQSWGSTGSYTYSATLYQNNAGDWIFDSLDLLPQ